MRSSAIRPATRQSPGRIERRSRGDGPRRLARRLGDPRGSAPARGAADGHRRLHGARPAVVGGRRAVALGGLGVADGRPFRPARARAARSTMRRCCSAWARRSSSTPRLSDEGMRSPSASPARSVRSEGQRHGAAAGDASCLRRSGGGDRHDRRRPGRGHRRAGARGPRRRGGRAAGPDGFGHVRCAHRLAAGPDDRQPRRLPPQERLPGAPLGCDPGGPRAGGPAADAGRAARSSRRSWGSIPTTPRR